MWDGGTGGGFVWVDEASEVDTRDRVWRRSGNVFRRDGGGWLVCCDI